MERRPCFARSFFALNLAEPSSMMSSGFLHVMVKRSSAAGAGGSLPKGEQPWSMRPLILVPISLSYMLNQ